MEDISIYKLKSSMLYCLVIAVVLLDASVLAQNCYTPKNEIGKCIPINYCEALRISFQNPNRGVYQTQYLINSQCGYVDRTPYVCCPLANQNNGGCVFGTCTVLAFCPSVLENLHKTYGLGPSGQAYLRQISCNSQNGFSVCCQDGVYKPSFNSPIAPPNLSTIDSNIPNVVSNPPSVGVVQNGGSKPLRPDIPQSNPIRPLIPTNPPAPVTQTEPPTTIKSVPVTTTQAPETPQIPPVKNTTLSPNTITRPIIISRPNPQNIQFAPPFDHVNEDVAEGILSRAGKCGVSSSDGRTVRGNETGLDQYPWMGLIEYDSRKGYTKVGCGSSLISKRYVLTAAHCVSRKSIQRVGVPINVRLGEFDKRLTIDCMPMPKHGRQECNDRPVRVPIEATVSHPNYDEAGGSHRNDIALIRLANDAPYTDFIRPICLPPYDITQRVGKSFELTVAGWGTTERGGSSNRKLHVRLPLVDTKMCQFNYTKNGLKVSLWEHQLCAGGLLGKDSCRGDSGGPLMMQETGGHYVLHGIVSFGPTPCARANVPGVYTKVAAYLPWIKSELKY